MESGNLSGKSLYIKQRLKIIDDFGIKITEDIKNNIESLYPNELAIERYTRGLILEYLGEE